MLVRCAVPDLQDRLGFEARACGAPEAVQLRASHPHMFNMHSGSDPDNLAFVAARVTDPGIVTVRAADLDAALGHFDGIMVTIYTGAEPSELKLQADTSGPAIRARVPLIASEPAHA